MKNFELNLFADYFQFYLQDEKVTGDLSMSWTDDAVKNLLALAPGAIGIGTARNMFVPVKIQIYEYEPIDNFDDWDKINECGIEILSGKIVVAGCSDSFPEAKRISVAPGNYRARIYYGNLKLICNDGLKGSDYYKVSLWMSEDKTVRVIKS